MQTLWRLFIVIVALIAIVAVGAGLLSIVAKLFIHAPL
ncbi:hypothetical protein AWB65_05946 [Caballeronia humi]|jgi:hypothetical protein|uniref:Uncharacterized protein n=1 Tax=Caballeronia humi TaxID=326474 RepID=A0A158J4J3_9BURK|nr:hypothetical protein AWB65_05946 [Caballeronia humi]